MGAGFWTPSPSAAGGIPAYTAYVPTVAQNGARTITITDARWTQSGKLVHCWGFVTVTNAGTAGQPISVSLPVTAKTNGVIAGVGWVVDSGTAAYGGLARILSGAGTIQFIATHLTTTGTVGVAPSFALANGDQIFWNITYEAA